MSINLAFKLTVGHYGELLLAKAAELGLSRLDAADLDQARSLAERLMSHKVASAETFLAAAKLQPASSLAYREGARVTGVLATLFLRETAEPDLMAGRFNGLVLDERYLSRADEAPGFFYIWGIAGETKRAMAAVMRAALAMRHDLFADLTGFARAATPDGHRIGATRLGFHPLRHHADDVLISRPLSQEQAA